MAIPALKQQQTGGATETGGALYGQALAQALAQNIAAHLEDRFPGATKVQVSLGDTTREGLVEHYGHVDFIATAETGTQRAELKGKLHVGFDDLQTVDVSGLSRVKLKVTPKFQEIDWYTK